MLPIRRATVAFSFMVWQAAESSAGKGTLARLVLGNFLREQNAQEIPSAEGSAGANFGRSALSDYF